MAKLYIVTQDQENYGAHDWDGVGECPQYWKFKGGEDFFVPEFEGKSDADIDNAVISLRPQIEEDNNFFRRHIISWMVVADDFMTEFEKDQLEYEGKIRFPAKILELV